MIRFFIVLAVTTVIVAGATWVLLELGLITSFPSFFYQTLLLVPLSTFFIYRKLVRITGPSLFTQFYLLSMVVKLIAYLAYNVIMVLEDRKGALLNISFFLLLYVIFTILEVAFLYRKVTQ